MPILNVKQIGSPASPHPITLPEPSFWDDVKGTPQSWAAFFIVMALLVAGGMVQ